MTNRFDAVIFDWAGTTVDYGCFAPVQAFVEAFREFGVEPTMDETRRPMGMLKHDHIRTMMGTDRIARAWEDAHGAAPTDADVDAVYSHFEPKLLSILDRFADPKPGVIDAVAALREAGLKIGSTTGYTDAMMEIVVPKAAELGYAPDHWVSADGTQATATTTGGVLEVVAMEGNAAGDRVSLLKWEFGSEDMDPRRAAAMINAAREELADILRGEGRVSIPAPRCVGLDALFAKCSAMLRLNVSVRHVFGLVAVGGVRK